jgi:hypothetical protein
MTFTELVTRMREEFPERRLMVSVSYLRHDAGKEVMMWQISAGSHIYRESSAERVLNKYLGANLQPPVTTADLDDVDATQSIPTASRRQTPAE